jgi:SAM-dependent methyltransferase
MSRLFSYIKYFFYISYNWNIKIATHILLQEIRGEKKFGIHTTGADELKKLEEKGIDISHATIYMPVSYSLLDVIFRQLNLPNNKNHPFNHFLDIGCGKGRALCVAAHEGFKKVTGIDLSKELCERATENCIITRQRIPAFEFSVINNDAFYYEVPPDVDCIFMFNPFDEIIMSGVVENIRESLQQYPRNISIVYVNPLHKKLLLKAGFKEIFYSKKMKYLEVTILSN